MSTLLLSHPACLNHLTPLGHPERPDRLRAVEQTLEDERFQMLAREEAPRAPLEIIALCHPMDYIESIRHEAGLSTEHGRYGPAERDWPITPRTSGAGSRGPSPGA